MTADCGVEAALAVGDDGHVETVRAQRVGQSPGQCRLVLDQEHPRPFTPQFPAAPTRSEAPAHAA